MDIGETATRIVSVLEPVLWEYQAKAMFEAERRCLGLNHATYPALRPLMTRTFMHLLLTHDLPEGFHVVGETKHMIQVEIQTENVVLKYLKERRSTYPGGVPAAGHNRARRQYWHAPTLPGLEPTNTPQPLNLLLLWDYTDTKYTPDTFTMRVVHTTGEGKWGTRTPIDLSIELNQPNALETTLEFTADEEDKQFFIDISEEDNRDARQQ